MERIALTSSLGKLLDWCMKQGATDLHAQADRRYSFRVDGKLRRIPPEQFTVPTNDGIVEMLREAFSSSIHDRIEKQPEMDLSFLCDLGDRQVLRRQWEPTGNGNARLRVFHARYPQT